MMFLVGVCVSVLIGVSLGLLGGGGSILTVPTIHYVFGVEAHAAITSSLLVVGVTSLVALIPHLRAGRVRGRIGLVFGGASMLSAFAAGRLSRLVPPTILLIGFGVMMVVAALAMLRTRVRAAPPRASLAALIAQGLAVGAVTGFVGAGGGFVVVPALVVLVGLSMPEAVATSLMVIAMNSFVAFGATVGAVAIDGRVVGAVLIAAIAGGLLGGVVAGRVPAAGLRRGFGWFVLGMAAVILGTELSRLLASP